MVKFITLASFVMVVGLLAVPAWAQQPKPAAAVTPPPTTAPAPRMAAIVPLSVRVVITRSQEGKPATVRPYELMVPANDNAGASFTDGVQVLIPMVTYQEKTTGPSYKDVGTVIKCSASSVDGGRFRLSMDFEDASVIPDAKLPQDGIHGPWFQTIRAEQVLVLKDGQTVEFASGIDRTTGELVKVALTMTVVK